MGRQAIRDLRRRQRRRLKVRWLRRRLEQTVDPRERRRLIAKIRKVSATAPVPAK
jgi:hypothetical protein